MGKDLLLNDANYLLKILINGRSAQKKAALF